MSETFCVVYDMGPHDSVEEEGSKAACDAYVNSCQTAYDKPLKIIPRDKARIMSFYQCNVVTGYAIE